MLGVHPETLYRWLRAGKLKSCIMRLPTGRLRINLDRLFEELETVS
jgi:predicted site-specific integrase-resolvase